MELFKNETDRLRFHLELFEKPGFFARLKAWWRGQPEFAGGFKSFDEAKSECERLNGAPFKQDGPFLHDYRPDHFTTGR